MPVLLDLQIEVTDHTLPKAPQFQKWLDLTVSENLEVTIRIVDENESSAYNQTYRHKKGSTNVLSFPFEQPEDLALPILGDIVLCAPLIEYEAKQQNKPLEAHYAHLTLHGCLHLLGYDHIQEQDAQRMEQLEISLLKKLDYPNPYDNGEPTEHARAQ